MRPEILFPLFQPVDSLPGIGSRLSPLFEKLTGGKVADLLWHLPSGLVDRRAMPAVEAARDGEIATFVVRVDAHLPGRSRRSPYKIRCLSETGILHLVYFNARPDYLERTLPSGSDRAIGGRVERFNNEAQIVHPDHVVPKGELESIRVVEPVYPLTGGLTAKSVGKAVANALERAPELPEWLDSEHRARQGWPGWRQSLQWAHSVESPDSLEPQAPARRRLAYDELLAGQLALGLIRRFRRDLPGRPISGAGGLRETVAKALPYELTGAQRAALGEILEDARSDRRMLRLLQGDVGSGKTVVSLMAMLNAIECGAQAALLAPTEVLARQHFDTIAPLAAAAATPVEILTGRTQGKQRSGILRRLAEGETKLVVGTHALLQDDVGFADLALAVIDEQHRFGVEQRLALAKKGPREADGAVDMLVMTATPIPRTLLMTAYGDLDVSRIAEKPAGRQPIDTRALPVERLDDVVAGLERAIAGGAKAYWVCPLVAESETLDLAAAKDRSTALSAHLPGKVGLVHGQMKPAEKDEVMRRFAAPVGAPDGVSILVATTVIEVGVDIPDATVMVVEHAERFGLAQLHQLRGRVGRGAARSNCVLLYDGPLGETAMARLRIMRETEDGFRIAEEDLRLRGGGEVLGLKQSGLPRFRLADPAVHADLLETARNDARMIVEADPELKSERGQALRVLLYLFEKDAAARILRSG